VSEPVINNFVFPPALVTRADLARIVREVETIDVDLEAQKARNHTTGQTGYHLPNLSRSLNDFVEINKVNIADDHARMLLKEQLRVMKDKAPIMHLTFAVEADPGSLQQLLQYIREQIHPQALLTVGLQPAIIGGVYMRTPNHVHDLTIRSKLAQSRGVILQEIEQLSKVIEVVPAPPEDPAELAARQAEAALAAQAQTPQPTQPPQAAA
jgi:hypothetical protein